jgi:hypothetical protein
MSDVFEMIDKDIESWKNFRTFEDAISEGHVFELCKKFQGERCSEGCCDDCPVKEYTSVELCRDTPVYDYDYVKDFDKMRTDMIQFLKEVKGWMNIVTPWK